MSLHSSTRYGQHETAPDFIDSRDLVLLGGFEADIDCLKLDRG